MKRLTLSVYVWVTVVFTVAGYPILGHHAGFVVSASSQATAGRESNASQQQDQPPVVLVVERGPGKYYTYRIDGRADDPLRLCGDALRKYGRERQFFIVVDSRLPIRTLKETDSFPEKAGFPRENIKYFENYGDGKMSEITWGPVMPIPGE